MPADLPAEFFALNDLFARRASRLGDIPLAEAYLKFTHLYLAFGLGRSFDPAAPAWQEFLTGLGRAPDPTAWIDQTYHRLQDGLPERVPERCFGCFSYSLWSEGRVRLHFWNPDPRGSPLAREHLPERIADLRALLQALRSEVPAARTIVGGSWLYHIEAYRRIFPAGFLATAQPEEPPYPQFIALWGQFLDHRRQVKPALAEQFRAAAARAGSLDELLHCFPYPVLRLECPVEVFF